MKRRLFLIAAAALALLAGCAPSARAVLPGLRGPLVEVGAVLTRPERVEWRVPASCPVTRPPDPPFVPPGDRSLPPEYGEFWYGTPDLWALLPLDGVWRDLPYSRGGYTQKLLWFNADYNAYREPQPALVIAGRRLDGDAPPLLLADATNGMEDHVGHFMLTGGNIPTPGCWEITGRYRGHELSYVVWVAP